MAYIGRPLNAGNLAVQSGTGDGSDTTPIATLNYATTTNGIAVYLDGVRQLAGTDYNVTSQTTLTFTTAPANGVGVDVYFLGLEVSIPTPADSSISEAKLADNSVTLAKMAGGTDGQVITYDASGDPVAVGPGTDGQVLTSTGAGSPPAFEDAGGGGAWTLIGTAVASSSASLTITGLDTSTYESFCIRLTNLVGASDGQALWVRLGDSGGIDSGGSDYSWVGVKNRSGSSSPAGGGSASIGQIIVDTAFGTGTGESVSCTMWLSAASATDYPNLTYHSLAYSSVPDSMCNTGGGSRKSAINVTQIQILSSSGDLTSGRMTVWGIAHA